MALTSIAYYQDPAAYTTLTSFQFLFIFFIDKHAKQQLHLLIISKNGIHVLTNSKRKKVCGYHQKDKDKRSTATPQPNIIHPTPRFFL